MLHKAVLLYEFITFSTKSFTYFQLGLNEIFAESSDLSGLLDSNEPLRVSDVIHKTFIEVDEQEAEAAAVTGNFSIYIFFSNDYY